MPDALYAAFHFAASKVPLAPVYQSPFAPGVCTKPTDTRRQVGFWLPEAFERATHSAFAPFTASSMALLDSLPSIDFTPTDPMADFTFSRVGEPKESLYTHVILPVPPAEPSPAPVPSPEPPPPSAANAPTTGDASVAAATRPAIVALPHFLFLLEPNVPSPFRDSACRYASRLCGQETGRRERTFPARFPSRGPAHPIRSTRARLDKGQYWSGGLRGMGGTGKRKTPPNRAGPLEGWMRRISPKGRNAVHRNSD